MKNLHLLSVGAWAPFDHIYVMEKYPSEGETIQIHAPEKKGDDYYYGDCSINIAYAAARLGMNCSLATVVGKDFENSGYSKYLQEAGVSITGTVIDANEQSGHNFMFFDKQGKSFCMSYLGAAEKQSNFKVPTALIHEASHVVISEMFGTYTLEALCHAKKAGCCTIINGMIETAGCLLENFLKAADLLFINESEYSRLVSRLGDKSLITDFDIRAIYVTMGKKGCKIITKEKIIEQGAIKAHQKCDTTGAGDSFAAGTIVGLMRGYSYFDAARIGSAVSSFIIEKWGCQTNAPSWEDAFLRSELDR